MSSPEHMHHFDDHFVRAAVAQQMGLPADFAEKKASKVRKGGGQTGSGRKTLSESVISQLEQRWTDVFATAFPDVPNFDAMRAAHPLSNALSSSTTKVSR
jgi:hypothetical protein